MTEPAALSCPTAKLSMIVGGRDREMHTIRPDQLTAGMSAKVLRNAGRVVDATPASWLLDPATRRRRGTYKLHVPSDSTPGLLYDVRVSWHDAYVDAGHYGHGCDAAAVGRACWHLYAAVLHVAQRFHGGQVPVAARPLRPVEVGPEHGPAGPQRAVPDREFYA